MIVERIRDSGHPIDPRAADIADALMSAGVHDRLVVAAGWSPDDYEDWLKRTLVTALLAVRPDRAGEPPATRGPAAPTGSGGS